MDNQFMAKITMGDGSHVTVGIHTGHIDPNDTALACTFADQWVYIGYDKITKIENVTPVYHRSFVEVKVTDGDNYYFRKENETDYPELKRFPFAKDDTMPILHYWQRFTLLGTTYMKVQQSYSIAEGDSREYHLLTSWVDKAGFVNLLATWAKTYASGLWESELNN